VGKEFSTCGLIVTRNTKAAPENGLLRVEFEKFEPFYPKYEPLAKFLFGSIFNLK
tara:strand:- start:391 stop:555 length:165 start_codon:yes stop_codon:yes gene_type:complete